MISQSSITLQSSGGIEMFHDITEQVRELVADSGVTTGIVSVYSHHTTCSVITQELAFDMSMTGLETLQQDFVNVLSTVAPDQTQEGVYLHPGPRAIEFAAEHGEDLRGVHNADAHLRSALVGRGECIAVMDGAPDTGEFGRIYFLDFDRTRPRSRTVVVTVIGE